MIKVCLMFVLISFSSPSELPYPQSGRNCSLKSGGEYGVCVPLSECPHMLKGGRTKLDDVFCGLNKQVTLVCCSLNTSFSPLEGAVALSHNSHSIGLSQSDTSISQRKCKEYANIAIDGGNGKSVSCSIRPDGKKVGLASLGEFPHMASLLSEDEDNSTFVECGGSLISTRFVLSAAHCLVNHYSQARLKWVLLGSVDVRNTSTGQLIPIAQTIPHPDYRGLINYFDIGLIKLKTSPILSSLVRPACLPSHDENIASKRLVITGWGATSFAEDPSTDLRKAILIATPFHICDSHYEKTSNLPSGIHNASMLCAGHPSGKSDSCQGDSGGPIQFISPNHPCMYEIAGVTSFGKVCGFGIPGVYSRVEYFRRWIENIVWQ